jgi:hypothetical protein
MRAFPQHHIRTNDPRLGEHSGIFDGDVVLQPVLVNARVTLDEVQGVGVEGPRFRNPGLVA